MCQCWLALTAHTGTAAPTIDQPTILVNPIPENQGESTTPPFPVPDEKDFNDYILVFPADSGIKPIYVYLSKPPVEFLDVELYSDFKRRSRQGKFEADHMPSAAAVRAHLRKTYPKLDPKQLDRMAEEVASVVIPKKIHQKISETYGGRNTPEQVELDSKDLRSAVDRNLDAIKPALEEHGATDKQIEIARTKLHKLNTEQGLYK